MFEALSALRSLRSPSGNGLDVYSTAIFATLVSHADARGVAWPSQDLLALEVRCSRRQVIRALALLAKAGWIKSSIVATPGGGRRAEHTLTPLPEQDREALHVSRRGGASQSPPVVTPSHHHKAPGREAVVTGSPSGGDWQSKAVVTPSHPICPSDLLMELPIPPNPPRGAEPGVAFALSSPEPLPSPTKPPRPKPPKTKRDAEDAATRRTTEGSRTDRSVTIYAKHTYAIAYAKGQHDAGANQFSLPRCFSTLVDLAKLMVDGDGKPLRGDDLLAAIQTVSADYRRAMAPDAKYQSGFSPSKCITWINAGRPRAGSKGTELHQKPAASGPAWKVGGAAPTTTKSARAAG